MANALAEMPQADSLPRESGAASLLNGHYAPPPADKDGKTWVRTSALIQAEADRLYDLWRDMSAATAWQEGLIEVRNTGPKSYHLVVRDQPDGDTVEWEVEILAEEPGKRIAWRATGDEPENAGEVIFEPAPGGRGTMVTVLEQLRIGKLARMWESVTGRDPKQSVIENLRHFKAFAETGEVPRIEPQPHGDRGAVGSLKRAAYGEKITQPHGGSPDGTTDVEGSSR